MGRRNKVERLNEDNYEGVRNDIVDTQNRIVRDEKRLQELKRLEKANRPPREVKRCPNCGIPIEDDEQYCSQSCAIYDAEYEEEIRGNEK